MSFARAPALLAVACAMALTAAAEAKTYRIRAGADAETRAIEAFAQLEDGDEIRFGKGRFTFLRGFETDASRIKIIGAGADETVLSFPNAGDERPALRLGGERVTVAKLGFEDAAAEALRLDGVARAEVRELKARWTDGLGRVGVQALGGGDLSFDRVEVERAEAGVMIAGARGVSLRRLVARHNAIGVVVRNGADVELREGALAANGVGVAVISAPDAPGRNAAERILVRDTAIGESHGRLPAPQGLSAVPPGAGVAVVGGREVEIRAVALANSALAHIVVRAYPEPAADEAFSPLPADVAIREVAFGGFAGEGPLPEPYAALDPAATRADVLWDGVSTFIAGARPRSAPVRISIDARSLSAAGGPPRFVSLQLPAATTPISEALPAAQPALTYAIAPLRPPKLRQP